MDWGRLWQNFPLTWKKKTAGTVKGRFFLCQIKGFCLCRAGLEEKDGKIGLVLILVLPYQRIREEPLRRKGFL